MATLGLRAVEGLEQRHRRGSAGEKWGLAGGLSRGEREGPLAGLGPWAGDFPSCVPPSPSVNGDGWLCTPFAGLRRINRLTQGAVAQSGGSVSRGFIVLSHWGATLLLASGDGQGRGDSNVARGPPGRHWRSPENRAER